MNKAGMALLLAWLSLAGCAKETGPEETAPESAPAVAEPIPKATADPAAARPLASFAGMDGDGDGKVTSAEHAKATQTIFQMMDADTDGVVTIGEMDAARKAVGTTGGLSSEKRIAALDGDGDNQLTMAEYVGGSNALFSRMDANTDDALDPVEWAEENSVAGPTPAPVPSKDS